MSHLTVKYQVVESFRTKEYLLELLDREWNSQKCGDYNNIKRVEWIIQSLKLDEIALDQDLLAEPEFKKDIQKRVAIQKNNILRNKPITPLVVMYKNKYLIDGYARFFALKELRIKEAKVYFGKF